MLYDVFISHASEDKDSFVRALAENLRDNRVEVWYDEFSLKTGDSIRRSIDKGLAKSRFGIVVLSKAFLNKQWTQWELDGLVQRYNRSQEGVILPIWHGIGIDEVIDFSPPLADKMAISSERGIDFIVRELLKVIQPEGSALVEARDCLINNGFEPPVITDDWWLDVLEFMGSDFHLERWGFPLTPKDYEDYSRGERIAWAAMQQMWQEAAKYEGISQCTPPEEVLRFIAHSPGLTEMCHSHIDWLALFAPQLTIRGFGGPFEQDFEDWYLCSVAKGTKEREANSRCGSALTINGLEPACCEEIALRHPSFGDYEPGTIACYYVQGHVLGPCPKVYEVIDYIIWFLSDASNWVPERIRRYLLEGFKAWNVWTWHAYDEDVVQLLGVNSSNSGALFNSLYHTKEYEKFKLTQNAKSDLRIRIEHSIYYLGLDETSETLTERFLNEGFIEAWFSNNERRRRRKRNR